MVILGIIPDSSFGVLAGQADSSLRLINNQAGSATLPCRLILTNLVKLRVTGFRRALKPRNQKFVRRD